LDGLVKKLKEKILSYEGVLGVHDVTVHSYGEEHSYAVVHIEVSASETLLHAHDLVDEIERDVLQTLGIQLVAHVDPRVETGGDMDFECLIRAYLSDRFDGLTVHDVRIVKDEDGRKVYFDAEIPWESTLTGAEISAALRVFDPDYEYVVTEDRK
jgi:divalent metal cation (Fe/Co/Zn/Cd) transporter